jgi:predicted tellurium resistance membrane protein TerC
MEFEIDSRKAIGISLSSSGLIALIPVFIMLALRPILTSSYKRYKYLIVILFFFLLLVSCFLALLIQYRIYKDTEFIIANAVGIFTSFFVFITLIIVLAFTFKKKK